MEAANNGTRLHPVTAAEIEHMLQALHHATLSPEEEGRPDHVPKVGAVLVNPAGDVVASAHRGDGAPGDHAEYVLLRTAGLPEDLTGYTLFTTLEPCTKRGPGKVPCAERILQRKVTQVFIGMYDPNPIVHRRGWFLLAKAGIVMRDFTHDVRSQIRELNAPFATQYFFGSGNNGNNSLTPFDYSQNGGLYTLSHDGLSFATHWDRCNDQEIYALCYEFNVAVVHESVEVDDPSTLEFTTYCVAVKAGDTAVFRSSNNPTTAAYAFIKVIEVYNKERGSPCDYVKFSWNLCLAAPQGEAVGV